ncbi:MAG: hypothetical protein ACK40X_09470, partial [Armatimonadota bacterium]
GNEGGAEPLKKKSQSSLGRQLVASGLCPRRLLKMTVAYKEIGSQGCCPPKAGKIFRLIGRVRLLPNLNFGKSAG